MVLLKFQKKFMDKYGDSHIDIEEDAGPVVPSNECSGMGWQLLEPFGYDEKIKEEFAHFFEGEAMGFFSMK